MVNRPIRLGVAGLGRAFSLMLPTFLADSRIELVAACDPREEARNQFVADFGGQAYQTVEDLAADPSVEVVYVASPHQFHAAHTKIAASQGKHVLVEKPMAITMDECDQMINACADADVSLIVGHCHSFDSPYLCTRKIIESGQFGAVRMIHALNYTDFLFRPRRPEELSTDAGGGVIFSQAAHQVDVVRLLAGSKAVRVRSILGAWDASRPTEGAYSALLWFEDGAFASLNYSGYAHFDSDEWCNWTGEMGTDKTEVQYGRARKMLRSVQSSNEEAKLKAAGTYGGPAYKPPGLEEIKKSTHHHQHFGPLIVSCERADLRPMPTGVRIYGDQQIDFHELAAPAVPRFEVIDELYDAVVNDFRPIHDGAWARATLEVCLALLRSAQEGCDVTLERQVALLQ